MRLSVIIPAYNCAATLPATLDSILAQKTEGMEVICVNDGSTDDTLAILKKASQQDDRIRFVTIENSGPASARNTGIEAASGEYISFVDSDDLLFPGMFESMLSLAEEGDLDVVCCGYRMENTTGQAVRIQDFAAPAFAADSPEKFHSQLTPLVKAHLMYVIWNKLWKRSFLLENNLRFTNFLNGEDRLFNIQSWPSIRRFGAVTGPYYRYIIHGSDSLVNRYISNRFESAVACQQAFLDAYAKMGILTSENRAAIDFQFVKSFMACLTQFYSDKCPLSRREKRAFVDELLANDLVVEAINRCDNDFFYSRIVNAVLRTRNKTLILLLARMIHFLQYQMSSLFLKLKHNVKPSTKGDAT